MAFFLIRAIHRENENTRVDLDRGRKETIGRHPDSSIRIYVGTVSGAHATLTHDGESFVLEDSNSRNGTTVNGQVIEEPVKLYDDDRISFGDAEVLFYDVTQRRELPTLDSLAPDLDPPSSIMMALDGVTITENNMETITGETDKTSRFGLLDAKPAAKLKGILEISTALAGAIELELMFPTILDTLLKIFRLADRAVILMKDTKTDQLIPRSIKYRRHNDDDSVRISRTVIDIVMRDKKGIRSADAAVDEMFIGSESIADMRIRSMMCVPMLALDGEPIGIIGIDSLNPLGQFTDEDLEVLFAIAGQAALTYETARLMTSFAQKQKQDTELEIARRVQLDLLPSTLPQVPGYDFFASYESAQAVGGDYYDVFELSDGRICISFGDVAGKGVPGALIMSRMHSCVQSTMAHVEDVETAILAINDHMCASAIEGRFVTYILAIVDPKKHEITLSNAGHMSPMIRHADGRIELFDDDRTGVPIGIMEDYPYQVETRTLKPGDMILIVTDGVDEAMNSAGTFYGNERVNQFLAQPHETAQALGSDLLADVRKHANGYPQNDDITIFTIGRRLT